MTYIKAARNFSRMPRPTVNDIARAAGVSLATVDRVLNARPGVRAATIAKVRRAIEELGYVRDVAAANLARQRGYEFAIVVPEPSNGFLKNLHAAIDEIRLPARADRVSVRVLSAPAFDPHVIAKALMDLGERDVDGVAVMAAESPQVRDALDRLSERGVAVATMISDLPGARVRRFVGVNSVAAGRTAGILMGRFLGGHQGRIIALAGSMMARDNVDRRLGFDQVIGAEFPHLEVLPSLEGRDDSAIVASLLPRAFERAEDVVGVYCFGGGHHGLVDALRRLDPRRQLTVVVHELTPTARAALAAGEFDVVITQDLGHVVRSVLRVLRAACDGRELVDSQERIRIEVMVRENLQ